MKSVLNVVLESRERTLALPLVTRWGLFALSYATLTLGGTSLLARLVLG